MTAIRLKNAEDLARMRHAGQLLADVFRMLEGEVRAGVTTLALNDRVTDYIRDTLHARPASIGQYGYPFALNASLNDEVCHGMPAADRVVHDGDILNLDITLEKDGFIADASRMYLVGEVSPDAKRLVEETRNAMWAGIHAVRPGARLGDIGHAIEQHARTCGYSVVREYCGHGIGRQMHEAPEVLHFGQPGTGLLLKPGMVFTIEPMINQGSARLRHRRAGNWDIALTHDRQLSAQWEHTVAVTDQGVEVLTRHEDDRHWLA
ncbi:methionine aminopeptidase [Isoalcanivorax pacificus W11-5]|uniref:Methionine aminopeptidase n=1 Tax=Isoalcanivorax pacificus W11-5 TaxID=391936 RepID=A0A0B4XMM6_9GAMM|nr:type I methionyl aminopeptidase [Isoalcanivorax pacificus]AJD49619.1 methionine aminopeptidase [Isoalcanivorax pacificus W11-5]